MSLRSRTAQIALLVDAVRAQRRRQPHPRVGRQLRPLHTNRGVLLSAGVPYEIVSPYSAADLTLSDGIRAAVRPDR